ncbi:hypothetical protein GQ55_4G303800 [Panicum hallii var. hallii]|uniref:Uncharacterized protein n=1 Tax=Panicum hallii var. hallii TaxID=1504633 RepID=A0A2T7E1P5_9POAL|nr:hypothetical protein GQ55_4G303800 [Panicum hallii var. hallii]
MLGTPWTLGLKTLKKAHGKKRRPWKGTQAMQPLDGPAQNNQGTPLALSDSPDGLTPTPPPPPPPPDPPYPLASRLLPSRSLDLPHKRTGGARRTDRPWRDPGRVRAAAVGRHRGRAPDLPVRQRRWCAAGQALVPGPPDLGGG